MRDLLLRLAVDGPSPWLAVPGWDGDWFVWIAVLLLASLVLMAWLSVERTR